MSSTPSPKKLSERPDFEEIRAEAKQLHRSGGFKTLAAAQLSLANSYGFKGWPELKLGVEQRLLRRLIEDGQPEVLQAFLTQYPKLTRKPFKGRNTPLHHAASVNSSVSAGVLLALGADRSAKNEAKQTAADVAKAKGFEELATKLEPEFIDQS